MIYDILKISKWWRDSMYYFIINPNAKCGRGKNVWKKLEKILERENAQDVYKRQGGSRL